MRAETKWTLGFIIYLLLCLLMFSPSLFAADCTVNEPCARSCTSPTHFTDETPIEPGTAFTINWYWSTDQSTWELFDSQPDCSGVFTPQQTGPVFVTATATVPGHPESDFAIPKELSVEPPATVPPRPPENVQ